MSGNTLIDVLVGVAIVLPALAALSLLRLSAERSRDIPEASGPLGLLQGAIYLFADLVRGRSFRILPELVLLMIGGVAIAILALSGAVTGPSWLR